MCSRHVDFCKKVMKSFGERNDAVTGRFHSEGRGWASGNNDLWVVHGGTGNGESIHRGIVLWVKRAASRPNDTVLR